MGDLVVMSRPKPLPAREYFAGHSAEIHFFTGVRYYRMDDAMVAPAAATLGAPKLGKRRRSASQLIAAKRLRDKRKALA